MVDKEPTLTVDDTEHDQTEVVDIDAAEDITAEKPAQASAGDAASYLLDEQTLGRSESVFDSGVELVPPLPPPLILPPEPVEVPQPEPSLTQRERRQRVKLEARRVRRIVRYVEPWSVLKVSVIFYFCLWLIFLLAGVMLWSFAQRSGTLESIETLVKDLFQLNEEEEFWSGSTIFRSYAIGSLVLATAGVAFNVLLAVMYNLISDLTGGVRMTVIEEESARFRPPRRRQR